MKKSILIIGGGFGQLPAIKTAKKMGLSVICTDKNPNALCSKYADFFYAIDVLDKEKNLEVAKYHDVDGVTTIQSDLPIPTVGYINEKLGLKGINIKVANACSDKVEMRVLLKQENCSQPKFKIVTNLTEAKNVSNLIGYPCVVKAPDSSGSRGITKVYNESDVLSAFENALKYSRQHKIIVEEFIDGLEFGAQTFSENGKCKLVLLHSDILSSPPYMIPIGHSFPFEGLDQAARNNAINDIIKAVESLGIDNGPANVDCILDKSTNIIKIIEIGARIGATCLPELVHYHSGINWVEQTILNAIGQELNLEIKREKPVTAIILSAYKDGILEDYEFPEEIIPEILEYEITVELGRNVNLLRKGTDRIGKVVCTGDSVDDSIEKCMEFIDSIKVEISG